MTFFDSIASKFGYESLPGDVANKSFYDLKAKLPGSKGDLDFVSTPFSSYHLDKGINIDRVCAVYFERQGCVDRQHCFQMASLFLYKHLSKPV